MSDRSIFKENLKYHRIIMACIILGSIWATYEYNTDDRSYENGQSKIIGSKVNGKDEGRWTWYYEDGRKQMEGTFEKGKRNGIWTIWENNGNKASESLYKEDKLNGKFVHWYPNGQIEREGYYIDDKLMKELIVKNRRMIHLNLNILVLTRGKGGETESGHLFPSD